MGFKHFKKEPQSYSGKGFAWGGMILGFLQVLSYVLFIIAVMAWAGALS